MAQLTLEFAPTRELQPGEVSEDDFWKFIRELQVNVHPRVEGDFPYTSRFLTPHGVEYGRIEHYLEDGIYPILGRHFIRPQA